MKTILLFAVIIFSSIGGRVFAQDALAMNFTGDTKTTKVAVAELPSFEFRASDNNNDLKAISSEMIGDHFLGKLVSEKLYLLEAKYTYQVPIVPGNPQTRTMVRKPVIYDAVRKIERNLKKQVKKGEVSTEVASNEFNKVLDVAFNVLTAETTSFEKAITETNDVNLLTNLFTQRVTLVF
jgi:hypothetical protein